MDHLLGLVHSKPVSNPPCVSGDDYTSEEDVLIQTPGTYEVLVWDNNGDGSGTGAGGEVTIVAVGSSGQGAATPEIMRFNSLISSTQIARLAIDVSTGTPTTVPICGSVSACTTGPMSMFVDAYKNGANGGYIEFSLGWPNALNAYDGWTSGQLYGGANFDEFYLVVELEDNTPDATPPTVESDSHYSDLTSYVEGARTLYISLLDVNNPIDTTPANGPKLHYSTDGGNTYTEVSATSISS